MRWLSRIGACIAFLILVGCLGFAGRALRGVGLSCSLGCTDDLGDSYDRDTKLWVPPLVFAGRCVLAATLPVGAMLVASAYQKKPTTPYGPGTYPRHL